MYLSGKSTCLLSESVQVKPCCSRVSYKYLMVQVSILQEKNTQPVDLWVFSNIRMKWTLT